MQDTDGVMEALSWLGKQQQCHVVALSTRGVRCNFYIPLGPFHIRFAGPAAFPLCLAACSVQLLVVSGLQIQCTSAVFYKTYIIVFFKKTEGAPEGSYRCTRPRPARPACCETRRPGASAPTHGERRTTTMLELCRVGIASTQLVPGRPDTGYAELGRRVVPNRVPISGYGIRYAELDRRARSKRANRPFSKSAINPIF